MAEHVIVDAKGRPIQAAPCPRCGAGPESRGPSSGFGTPHPVCLKCGFDFHGERCA